jgi:hypothetical protein
MPRVDFQLRFHSDELRGLEVPIEIRQPMLTQAERGQTWFKLVQRTLPSQGADLERGTYLVSAKLPGGQELSSHVRVDDEDLTVLLEPEADERSPNESEEVSRYLTRQARPLKPSQEDALPASQLYVRTFTGDVSRAGQRIVAPDHVVQEKWQTDERIQLVLPPNVRVVQLVREGETPLNALVPAFGGSSSLLVVWPRQPGVPCFELHLDYAPADLVLGYVAQGTWDAASVAIASPKLAGERLLEGKLTHPLAAAVGAYALLRLNALERLHTWTQNLCRWFPELPDGAAIWGEHLARVGRDDEALSAFLDVARRGLPLFREGLSYTITRLRRYGHQLDRSSARRPGPATSRDDEIAEALARLEPFMLFADLRRPVLTYPGLEPSRPGQVVANAGDIAALGPALKLVPE